MTSTVLILRTCKADMTAHEGFRWPESGPVEAPDWDPTPECGHGLHGLLWGCGDASSITYPEGRWLVVEAKAADVVDLGGKVKFPRGQVVFVGTRDEAIAYLDQHGAADKPVVYATRTAGYEGTAASGDGGTATAGYRGTAAAGDYGTAAAGDWGEIRIRWHDGRRYRVAVGHVGEDGIRANVAYRVVDGKLTEVEA